MARLLENRKALHHQITEVENQCKALEEQAAQLQPLANLGLAWAMTAHELNNLLTPIANYAQLALQNPQDAALHEKALKKMLHASSQAAKMLEKVMFLAGSSSQEKKQYPLLSLLDDVFECLGRDFSKDKICVIRQIPENICVWGDITALQQVIMNLVLNARQAMLERGGTLKFTASEDAEFTRIEIADTGCGIRPENLKQLFTPFYTSGKKNGNGLGLVFCRKVIESHGGCIVADSEWENGSHFRILLPKSGA
ncbi:MAG: HAMP domain-containing histidine kinase [Planctomycetales bacterium]|nr:HAMP domain-containing histidine kinase [Planctomycetales bacterium]